MATELEVGFPAGGAANRNAFLSGLAASVIYPIKDVAVFEAEDITLTPFGAVMFDGSIYDYDSTDTVTASDAGVTTIVASGRRYKIKEHVKAQGSVISSALDTPPASPTLGDSYIIPVAPLGDWAAHARKIAVFTARGWEYTTPMPGMLFWVEDQGGYSHYSSAGEWVSGLPAISTADSSIYSIALNEPFIFRVEGTATSEPGSPTLGTSYIVGSPATGAFNGQENNVAFYHGGAWKFIPAGQGATVYDLSSETLLTFRAGNWEQTLQPASRSDAKIHTNTSANQAVGNGGVVEIISFQHTRDSGDSLLITPVTVRFDYSNGSSNLVYRVRVSVDAEPSPRKEIVANVLTSGSGSIPNGDAESCIISFADDLAHTVKIEVFCANASGNTTSLSNIDFEFISERLITT